MSMNNDLAQFSEERLKDMQKHVTAGMTLGHADALLIRQVIDIALAAKQAKPVGYFVHTLEDGVRGMTSIPDDSPLVKVATPLYTTPQPAHTERDGWIKCSERMPDRGVEVLACKHSELHGFIEIETAQWHGGMINETQPNMITSADSIQPTHWMPLPAAPKPESEL